MGVVVTGNEGRNTAREVWPELPLAAWADTCATLHLWMQVVGKIRLGRLAEPDEMSGAGVFLCSPSASFVTGQVLLVDEGLTAH